MTKVATIKLIVVTHVTDIKNSLSMISIRVVRHHFYIGLVYQRYFFEALPIIVLSKKILIITDSVIINIIHIHTVLDIKSKHYKENVLKLSIEIVVHIFS